MDFSALFKRAGKAAAKNSPAILTTLAATGTIATAVLAAQGAFKAKEALDEANVNISSTEEAEELQTIQGKAKVTWKCYVPAAATAAITVATIIGLNRAGERRAAAMATAFGIAEKNLKDYKAKTLEKVGKNKEQTIRDEIAQDTVDRTPIGTTQILTTGNGESLCFDEWSGRYFYSDMETIRSAVNDFNASVINESYNNLTALWDLWGLPKTSHSDDFGWDTDDLLEIHHTIVTVGNEPCIFIDFATRPHSRFDKSY